MSKLANELIAKYELDPESALGKLVAFTCQRTRFFGEDSKKHGWESTKALRRFRELLAEAMFVGVKPDHPIFNGGVLEFGDRAAACKVLESAIAATKREKFKGVREQDYSLHEMRRIAIQSGSQFFKSLAKGERVSSLKNNVVVVASGSGTSLRKRYHQLDCLTGQFFPIEKPIARLSDSKTSSNTVNSATIETDNI